MLYRQVMRQVARAARASERALFSTARAYEARAPLLAAEGHAAMTNRTALGAALVWDRAWLRFTVSVRDVSSEPKSRPGRRK